MSSAIPVPPVPPHAERRTKGSHRRSFWKKLHRQREFRQLASTAALWALTVVAVWFILKQIIK